MFIVRSAFWLTVAFVAFHPKDVDLGATANQISGQAMAAGQQIVVSQLLKNDCLLLRCTDAAAAASAKAAPVQTVSLTTQVSSPARSAPFPRPRPAWMG